MKKLTVLFSVFMLLSLFSAAAARQGVHYTENNNVVAKAFFSVMAVEEGVCEGATQPEQCAVFDPGSESLPPFVEDVLEAHGIDFEGCGEILVLSSGDPAWPTAAPTTLSVDMGNPGCGPEGDEENPDGFSTNDCVDLNDFTPEANSQVIGFSSEWEEYVGTSFTDWMRLTGDSGLDISIDDWPSVDVKEYTDYGPSGSGSIVLGTLSANKAVDLRVADSGDHVYDTALIVVPIECFDEPEQGLLCGNEKQDPGEECDDGNAVNDDGCSAQCLIEVEEEEPVCGNEVIEPGEECDDGNPYSGDGCSETCQEEVPECPQGECPPPENEIPEFTAIAAGTVLALGGLYAASRRKRN